MFVLRSKTDELSDEELVRLIAQGKESAYYTLFERHWERLYKISLGITRDEEIAKDVVQEVMLSVWKRRETLTVEKVGAYLSRSAKLQSLKTLRDAHLEKYETLFDVHIAGSPAEQLEAADLQASLAQALAGLPERCREVFLLSREEELSNAEIAQKLNISQRTVETHISNALSHLKGKLLLLWWIFSSLE